MKRYRVHSRHHCKKCGGRVFPFDGYDLRTEMPLSINVRKAKPDLERPPILLSSANRDPDERVAWCWSCDGWRECNRITGDQILQLYIERRGIVTRPPARRRKGRGKRDG